MTTTAAQDALDAHLKEVKSAGEVVEKAKSALDDKIKDGKGGTDVATEHLTYAKALTDLKTLTDKTAAKEADAKAAAEADAKAAAAAAAAAVVTAAEAVNTAAKEVERLTPTPVTSFSGPKKTAKTAAAEALAAAKAAVDSVAAATASPIAIDKLIAAANEVEAASALVVASATTLDKLDKSKLDAINAAAEADKLAKAASIKAIKLAPSTIATVTIAAPAAAAATTAAAAPVAAAVVPAAAAAAVVPVATPVKSDKDNAMTLIKSLSTLLDKGSLTFAELKTALDNSGLLTATATATAPAATKKGGGGGLRKKKTGISRRIRRSRVGANTRKSREFY